jgi:hypothetical protein
MIGKRMIGTPKGRFQKYWRRLSIGPAEMANELTVTAASRRPASVITPSQGQLRKNAWILTLHGVVFDILVSAPPELS